MLTRFATVEDARADIASSPLAERRFDVRKDDNGFYVCVYTNGSELNAQIEAAGYQSAQDPGRATFGTTGLWARDLFGREIGDHCLRLMCMGRVADDGDGAYCPSCGWRATRDLSLVQEMKRRLVGRFASDARD